MASHTQSVEKLKYISVRGAREHNLRNVDVDIPRDSLVVITGLSGSGKSSLAFDTIYAEGQRRYVESLSSYARQFLQLMQKPDVDLIEGLSPAISIEQKTTSKNPRSTVGTVTEIYDYLRLLYARVGVPYSPATGKPIESQTVSQMCDAILEAPANTRFHLLAPIVRGRKGEYRKEFKDLQKQGFTRVKVDGKFYEIDEIPELDKNKKHTIEVVVDRIVVNDELGNRLPDSIEMALKLSDGILIVENADGGESTTYSSKFACPESGFTIDEIEPRLFSFNNPFGACPACDGLGTKLDIDPALVVPNHKLTLAEGAIAPWSANFSKYYLQTLEGLAKHYKQDMRTPFNELTEEFQQAILWGTGKQEIIFLYEDEFRTYKNKKTFEGVIPNLMRRWKDTESSNVRDDISRYQSARSCDSCGGYRLKPEALCVKLGELHIGEVTKQSILEVRDWFLNLPEHMNDKQNQISFRILKEINERLGFLVNVGLEYLSLSRNSGTLSGGESQRIRLASQIGSGLTGVLYILDEPSIGLHQRDNRRLLETLTRLRELGNTVIVVEHDEDAIRMADHLIDMGPGAGVHGGEIIAQGLPHEVFSNPKSITGQYLSGVKEIPIPKERRSTIGKRKLTISNATGNNLQNVSVDIPLGVFTCITGVSGSGKSTLTIETLYKGLAKRLNGNKNIPAPHDAIRGTQFLDKIIDIDQSPIGRTPRSNPATYTGAFTPIREWFAGLPEAKARGYNVGRFSFNVKGGRCEACQGDGMIKIEMHFLADVYVTCDVCKGHRYNRETLEIKYKGKSISDVLEMTVEEAAKFFVTMPAIRDKLETLERVGLGYIKVGQQATTLSGGEAQRVKLAKELSRRATGRTLYLLDEPTTGLHFEDINKLLDVLHALVDQGNTIIVIEHNLDVIKTADWIIDMGPEGGTKGGEVVAIGTPEDVAKVERSYTGQYLKSYLDKSNISRQANVS
jgi:excinuclease ABC subunit A